MKYVSVSEMIAIEKEANSRGLTYDRMMENAGFGLAEVVDGRYQHLKPGPILGLVGSGNNGGDTLVAMTHLSHWGWKTQVYLAKPRKFDDPLSARFIEGGGKLVDGEVDESFQELADLLEGSALVLDGVLGTGIKLPLRGRLADVIGATGKMIAEMAEPPAVVAVDCPSGVDCDSGDAAPECIGAELTVTMAAIKMGLLKFPAYNYVGELQLVGIGLPDDLEAYRSIRRFVADSHYVRQVLPERKLDAHKGTFGTALILAGSVNYTGAAILAGESAYRIGAGLVTLGVPEPLHGILAGRFLEATWLPLPHQAGAISEEAFTLVSDHLERPTALLIGPGFGLADTTRRFLSHFLRPKQEGESKRRSEREKKISPHPALSNLVLDADGLKLLASLPDWSERLPAPAVLTPHPGEMSVLTGLSVSEILADRVAVAEEHARRWGHVVILKGPFSVIASPDGRTATIPVATPALARAGTGDVLAGLIVGLRAQGVEAFEAAVAGAWIHGKAGEFAADMLGSTASVIAGDVLQGVIALLAEVYSE